MKLLIKLQANFIDKVLLYFYIPLTEESALNKKINTFVFNFKKNLTLNIIKLKTGKQI